MPQHANAGSPASASNPLNAAGPLREIGGFVPFCPAVPSSRPACGLDGAESGSSRLLGIADAGAECCAAVLVPRLAPAPALWIPGSSLIVSAVSLTSRVALSFMMLAEVIKGGIWTDIVLS